MIGNADRGFFNQQNRTISVRITSVKLNAILSAANRPTVGFGGVFCGLRAAMSLASTVALEDISRGGTEFTISNGF